MKSSLTPKQFGMIALIVLAGLILAVVLLRQDKHGHDDAATPAASAEQLPQDAHAHDKPPQEAPRGPHGGRLLAQQDYAIEVLIFEQNVAPHFRLYAFADGQPLDPAASSVTLELKHQDLSRTTDLLCDRHYPPLAKFGGKMVINPFGYRWIRVGGVY